MTAKNKTQKYPVELSDYECQLILDNAMVFDQLQKNLTNASQKEGVHKIMMTLLDIQDIAGWLAAESNHADNEEKEMELGDLCDYFESIEFDCKRKERQS